MSETSFNPYRLPGLQRLKDRLESRFSDFEPAIRQAGMIPRGGVHPEATINLSVAPSKTYEDYPNIRRNSASTESLQRSLLTLWQKVLGKREASYLKESGTSPLDAENKWLPTIAFAPNTDSLFEQTIAPLILAHSQQTGKKKLLVPDVGYPLPFWFQEKMPGIMLVEGMQHDGGSIRGMQSQLDRYIQEKMKLPPDIAAVYLDYPSTVETRYTGDQLISFIRQNPQVLFIIDQANLYFSRPLVYEVSRDIVRSLPRLMSNLGKLTKAEDCLVLVTNTTSKAMGSSGCASISATREGQKLLEETLKSTTPYFTGFTDDSLADACDTVSIESYSQRYTTLEHDKYSQSVLLRENIDSNRRLLWTKISKYFGSAALPYPSSQTIGPHFFIDARKLGFENGEALSSYLATEHSIGTKTAEWYGNTKKHPELLDYVYIGVPVEQAQLDALLRALEDIKEKNRR